MRQHTKSIELDRGAANGIGHFAQALRFIHQTPALGRRTALHGTEDIDTCRHNSMLFQSGSQIFGAVSGIQITQELIRMQLNRLVPGFLCDADIGIDIGIKCGLAVQRRNHIYGIFPSAYA